MFKLKRLFVCICSNYEQGTERLAEETLVSAFRGISSEMVNMFSFGSDAPAGKCFPVEELVPEDILNGDKPTVFAFSPLYFKDDFLGYNADPLMGLYNRRGMSKYGIELLNNV